MIGENVKRVDVRVAMVWLPANVKMLLFADLRQDITSGFVDRLHPLQNKGYEVIKMVSGRKERDITQGQKTDRICLERRRPCMRAYTRGMDCLPSLREKGPHYSLRFRAAK
jgi:hypothetical protein